MHLLLSLVQDTVVADTTVVTGGGFWSTLDMNAVFTAIASVLVIFVMQGLKALSPKFVALSDLVKGLIAGVFAVLAGVIQSGAGVALSGDVFAWDAAAWQAVLVWGMSMGYHAFVKKGMTAA